VHIRAITISGILTAAGLMLAGSAQASFNFGDMMNPSRWMGGNRDRYDDYGYRGYGYPGYGYGGYPGYGYGGGYPGYGYGGYPGYGYPGGYGGGYQSSPVIITPQSSGGNKAPPPQVR